MTLPAPANNHSRDKAILTTILIFLVLGATWFTYWWVWGRFHESTDDAYVDGNNVVLTPQIPGIVTSFSAIDADYVPKGRILVELDKIDASIELSRTIADLGNTVRKVAQLFEQAKQYEEMTKVKRAEFIKAAQDYEHRKNVIGIGGVSLEDFEHAEAALKSSFSDLAATEHLFLSTFALVENTTVADHPMVDQAKNALRDAFVFYQRCTLKAPVSGIVAQRTVQVGEQVQIGQPLMAVVPLDQMWVTANFKEVQISHMRVGQPVKIFSDTYGREVIFDGVVAGIGGGTGSVFSVLPPQNATGNWIKIVQRVPVRILLDPEQIKQHPLRLGLSMTVTVDIRDTLKPYVPAIKPDEALYATDVFSMQEQGAEELINQVILENLNPIHQEEKQ
jgi:membrane fusion protein, multidrug efflux system